MRTPADDASSQRKSRWRGRGARAAGQSGQEPTPRPDAAAGSGRIAGPRHGTRPRDGAQRSEQRPQAGRSGGATSREAGRPLAGQGRGTADRGAPGGRHSSGRSVFTPGYDRREPGVVPARPDPAQADRPAGAAAAGGRGGQSGYWRTPAADGATGKGPVRGFPPAPGQPPPLYPPGQFSAWNRPPGARATAPGDAAPPPGTTGRGPAGRAGPRQDSGAWPQRSEDPQPPAGGSVLSRYYSENADASAEPGYPILAVSDPAADVTSTQTWRAVAEGRSTGIWTAPPGLREDGTGKSARSAAGLPVRTPGLSGAPAAPASAANTGPNPRITTGPNPRITTGPNPRVTTGQRAVPAGAGAPKSPGDGRRRAGTPTRRPRRSRPASVKFAVAVALLLVLAAAGTLGYTVLHRSAIRQPTTQATSKASPSAAPSPTLGPYGHIASRQTDPQPLTLAQLYPASFRMGGASVVSTATNLSSSCTGAIVGGKLQSAVSAAGCTQVARATYLDAPGSLMGTIGVLNLSTGDKAKAAAQAADANDFISQLAGPRGPTQKIGHGTGIEEAAAKGHYLILIWAQFTNVSNPTSSLQRTEIENFMTELLQNTANVTLTTRMLTGAP